MSLKIVSTSIKRIFSNLALFKTRPTASEVLTTYLLQCEEPPWTSYFVKYSSVKDDQFGMSNFNWTAGSSNYQVLRTGCFPYIKYHCSRRRPEDLDMSDRFMRVIKVVNLGPPSLPIYGGYCVLACISKYLGSLAAACTLLGRRYRSKMVGLYLGEYPGVIVNDPVLVREMLNRDEFDGRMDIIVGRLRAKWKRLGIFFTDGYFWHVQRRFSLRYMRDYGFGRRCEQLESSVEREIHEMLAMRLGGPRYPVEREMVKGELVYMPHYFAIPFINGVLSVLAKVTLPRENYDVLYGLAKGGLVFQRSSDDIGGALSLTPWLKDVAPSMSGYKGLREGNQFFVDFFEKLIEDASATHDESHDRHFLDVYIRRMKEEARRQGRTTFATEQLVLICTDYLFPAATAVESVLALLVERMLLQEEVQQRVHEELDRVVGRDRLPTLDDRRRLPYTEACIRETMRYDTIVPLGLPHRAMRDTTLGGYNIPENTMVSANYVPLHTDKCIWGDPENFRPERYIVDGQLKVACDKTLPFGAGRRLCAGETYARQTMFQVFAAFMQTFHVSAADGRPLQRPAPRIPGLITTIPEFWVRVMPRY